MTHFGKIAVAVLMLLAVPVTVLGSDRLERLLEDIRKDHSGVSALALTETMDAKEWRSSVAGILSPVKRVSVDPHTLFRACSLSKPVFALLIMKLAATRQIDLDRPLYLYLRHPLQELPGYADLQKDGRHRLITARMVLSHQTGLPNWRWHRKDNSLVFLFEPGKDFSYSGEGYRFLQLVVEQITGRGLNELCQKYVFGPLNMADSTFLMEKNAESRLAINLDVIPPFFLERMRKEANAAGSLLTSIVDYGRFLAAVMSGTEIEADLRAEMLRPQIQVRAKQLLGPLAAEPAAQGEESGVYWCLGWARKQTALGDAYFHVGAEEGSENFVLFFPERKQGMVVLSSGPDPSGAVRTVVERLYGQTGIPFEWLGY